MDRYVNEIKNSLTNEMKYEKTFIHPEESGNEKVNKAFTNGFDDVTLIDKQLKDLAGKTEQLLERTTKRLDVVKDTILAEKERLQDISMLCNMKTDYDNAIPLKDSDFTGDFSFEDGVFYSKLSNSVPVKAIIEDVVGNGYEGNKYVVKDNKFLEEVINTKSKSFATDSNLSTYWEYSRITASNTEPYLISDFNTDDSEAKATVTLKFAAMANELMIKSSVDKVRVLAIKYSKDGINYNDVAMLPFTINNKDESYKNQGYIYGSNLISFPSSKYVKITFESIGYIDDILAFERTVTDDKDQIETITTVVPTAKRHVIKLNDIYVKSKTYTSSSTMKTGELITKGTDIYAISIFANMYFPKGVPDNAIKFTLTVNGIDYEIQPVNSHKSGVKIIRFSQGKMPAEYTKYIGEKIQSAYLTISMSSRVQLTPYINNLKILLGGAI